MIHCDKIFAIELDGNRFLVGTILEGIHKTLDWIHSPNELFKKARSSAIKLLFPLISISRIYHKHKVPFNMPEPFKKQDSISMIVIFLFSSDR